MRKEKKEHIAVKRIYLLGLLVAVSLLLSSPAAYANNLRINSVKSPEPVAGEDYAAIDFTISWANSWNIWS